MKLATKVYLVLALILLTIPAAYYSNSETLDVEVTGAERINNSNGGYYLVYTNKEVFKNVDNSFYLKWNSSDFQGQLRPSKSVVYKIKVSGFRIPFLSMYRNIVAIKDVKPVAQTEL